MSIYMMRNVDIESGGGIDSNTKLMLHCDGANGSTTFTDSSFSPKTATVYGNSNISTSKSKFGGASAYFDGSNDYLTFSSTDFDLGTSDFTIDFWIYVPNTAPFQAGQAPLYLTTGTNNAVFCPFRIADTSGTITSYISGTSAWSVASNKAFSTLSRDTWVHLAISRSGSNWYLFENGIVKSTISNSQAIPTIETVYIARNLTDGSIDLCCYIDEFRISKEVARWTANFTPPIEAYSPPTVTPTNMNVEIAKVYRSYSGVNRDINQISRSYSGVNREVFRDGIYLYNAGNENVPLTGGWASWVNNTLYTGVVLTKNADNLECAKCWEIASVGEGMFYSTNAIDITNYSRIIVDAEVTALYSAGAAYRPSLFIGTSVREYQALLYQFPNAVTARQEYTVDISAITGGKYLSLEWYGATGRVYSLRLE